MIFKKNIIITSCSCGPPRCATIEIQENSEFVHLNDDYGNTCKIPIEEMKILAKKFLEEIDNCN